MYRLLLVFLFAFSVKSFCEPIVPEEFPDLDYPIAGTPLKLTGWRIIQKDDPGFAAPDLDDSTWRNIEVGRSLLEQKTGGPWVWYRVAFELPDDWSGYGAMLDLGYASAYDEIFVNGVKCGKFGTPPPNLMHGCSGVYRRYPINPGLLKPGQRNVLAIRLFVGSKGGLYEGPYTLNKIPAGAVFFKFNLKGGGENSLKTMLTEAVHLNNVLCGGEILINPGLICLDAPAEGELLAELQKSDGPVLESKKFPVKLKPGEWHRQLIRFSPISVPGNYFCHLSFGPFTKKLAFRVTDDSARLKFSIPADPGLAGEIHAEFPIKVTPGPLGRYGHREYLPEKGLHDDPDAVDSRTGMAYMVRTGKTQYAPQLFLGNVRPVPKNHDRIGRFHRAAGHNFDALGDAWIYGRVCPNRAGKLNSLTLDSASWTGRSWLWKYENGETLKFTVSTISPAWRAESSCTKLRVFDGCTGFGIGLPSHLAYQARDGIRTVKADTGIKGEDMTANWILAWYNGAPGWDEFDTPYLFVLQKRPQHVKTYMNAALFFENRNGAGLVQGMPLYGAELLLPEKTRSWRDGLPDDAAERCRYWSRVLAAPPLSVARTAKVSYDPDVLLVKDRFSYLSVDDDWQTSPLKIAPVSTTLPLARDIRKAVSCPVSDLMLTTLQGPLLAAGDEAIVYRFDGLLRYIREVRALTPAAEAGKTSAARELYQLIRSHLNDDWAGEVISRGRVLPGGFRVGYTNLLLTRPYLPEALRREFDTKIRAFSDRYLLCPAVPESGEPAIIRLKNPLNGLELAMPNEPNRFGIDMPYFSNLNIYMAWEYSYFFNRPDFLKEHYPLLKAYFNTARNSHDWATLASWDTFSGIRVGNGMQESGGMFCGAAAMARIARELDDLPLSDLAAYQAVMLIVSMDAAVNSSEYLKQRRPFTASHSRLSDIEYSQKAKPAYVAEFNEFVGLSQLIIGSRNPGGSPGGYIESPLPELMRLYQEIWKPFTDDFYDPAYDVPLKRDLRKDDRLTLDAYVYQTTRSPEELKEIFEYRLSLPTDWLRRIADLRSYLDSQSTLSYKKLW